MFYRLNDFYILRGWQRMTAVLIKRPRNDAKALSAKELNLLLLCDGCTEFESLIAPEEQQVLDKWITEGVVSPCEVFTPLNEEQRYIYYPNRYMRSAFWSITGRCNYRCRHCYMDAPDARLGEISHGEALNFIDQMNDCGILRIDLTGGEPFVRKDFWQLVDRICQYKMVIGQVYTNGWLMTEQMLDAFEVRGQHPEFSISFDGLGWHDWMRGVKGAEDAAFRAFRLCKRRGFPVNVEMCLHKGNLDTVRETMSVLNGAGVYAVKIGRVQNTELWRSNAEGNELTYLEYCDAALKYIPQYYEDALSMRILWGGIIDMHSNNTYQVVAERYCGDCSCEEHHLCGAVRSACYITPEGRVMPCISITSWDGQYQYPRIQDEGLQKLLSGGFYMDIADARVKDLLHVNETCAACEYKYKCGGGCRAAAAISSNNIMGCDPDQCAFFKNGYPQKVREVADAAIAKYCKKVEKP